MNAAVADDVMAAAREEAWSTPLDQIDVSRPERFATDTFWPFFERLRKEAPVHYCAESMFGPYWSVTRYKDIMHVEMNHKIFSSEPAITIIDPEPDLELPMFIAMDPPRHDEQRKVVSPVVAPPNLQRLEGTIRERVADILDGLPRGETFDWVDRVSVELTARMLATILGVPQADRRKLTRWSDIATARPDLGIGRDIVDTNEERHAELFECVDYFTGIWNQRVNSEPGNDLISMLAHGESTRNMDRMEYLGNLLLLIVGGNDTTRNSISGGLLALDRQPDEMRKVRENPALIRNMVAEIIRWQTPLSYMRRTATQDADVGGKTIRKGDKIAMWYVSGNRDEAVFDDADALIVDRPNARHHVAFGYGIHRCMGNRLAEMQLRVLWEELLPRFRRLEVVGKPVRIRSNFINGYSELPVVVERA